MNLLVIIDQDNSVTAPNMFPSFFWYWVHSTSLRVANLVVTSLKGLIVCRVIANVNAFNTGVKT